MTTQCDDIVVEMGEFKSSSCAELMITEGLNCCIGVAVIALPEIILLHITGVEASSIFDQFELRLQQLESEFNTISQIVVAGGHTGGDTSAGAQQDRDYILGRLAELAPTQSMQELWCPQDADYQNIEINRMASEIIVSTHGEYRIYDDVIVAF